MSDQPNILLILVSISLGILLINTMLLLRGHHCRNRHAEHWYNGEEVDLSDYGQKTKRACSCPSYGFKNQVNMPFNDDSSLYK